jgi:hypothetical protein
MKFSYNIIYFIFCCATSCQTVPQAIQQSKEVYIKLADQEMFSFAREVQESNHLQLMSYGGGFYDGIDKFSLGFSSPESPTVDESRTLFY